MSPNIIFDSYALLDLLEDGDGAQVVADCLSDPDTQVFLSMINLGEIYYITLHRRGKRSAEEVIENILLEESIALIETTWPRIKAAAFFKAEGGLSYADCFVLALADESKGPVVTGDPEIILQAGKEGIEVIDIRKNPPSGGDRNYY